MVTPAAYQASWNPTEAEFQACVIEAAQWHGWLVFHPYSMRRSPGSGWPDLALAKPGRLILWELKTHQGRPSVAQRSWLDVLGTVSGITCALVTPSDWDAMLAELSGERGRK